MEDICGICNRKFEKTHGSQLYCSELCKKEARNIQSKKHSHKKGCIPLENRECKVCKKTFNAKFANQKYCSKECKKRYYKKYNNEIQKKKYWKDPEKARAYNRQYNNSKRNRKKAIVNAIIDLFLIKYCEKTETQFTRYDLFYASFLEFSKRFNISIRCEYLSYLLKQKDLIPINTANRKNRRGLIKVKFNKKGMTIFGSTNPTDLVLNNTDILTSKQACLVMSCQPGRQMIQGIYNSLSDDKKARINLDKTIEIYKKIESELFKKNFYRKTGVKIGLALYLNNYDLTQTECGDITGTTDASIRAIMQLLKLKKEPIKSKKDLLKEICPNCKNEFTINLKNKKYCSKPCFQQHRRKVINNRSKERYCNNELKKLDIKTVDSLKIKKEIKKQFLSLPDKSTWGRSYAEALAGCVDIVLKDYGIPSSKEKINSIFKGIKIEAR